MPKNPWPRDDLTCVGFWRAVAAEYLATTLLVFVGCGSIISFTGIPLSVERIALTFGLAIAILVQLTGKISGGHINPAVTVAMFARFKIGIFRCVFYIAAQVVGAICGAAILYGVTPAVNRGTLGTNNVGNTLTAVQGLGCEIVLTFMLVLAIFASTDDETGGAGNLTPLMIGLTVTVTHLMGIPFSGASMNPARSLGPAVVSGSFKNHWIYWVGPLIGGPVAGWIYRILQPGQCVPVTPEIVVSNGDDVSVETTCTGSPRAQLGRLPSSPLFSLRSMPEHGKHEAALPEVPQSEGTQAEGKYLK